MDKQRVIRCVADVLKETPSAQDIVKKGGNRDKRFVYLATHMVEKAIEKDALLTQEGESGGLGVAILLRTSAKEKNFWKELGENLNLVKNVTGVKNALKILKEQNYIAEQRPKKGEYLYAWFWGIDLEGRGPDTHIASNMKNQMVKISEESKLTIYSETRLRTNAIVYQRYRFENFHTWKQPGGSTMWFLRYVPKSYNGEND